MYRRIRQLILALYAAALLAAASMVGGAWLNDRAIASDPGRALATVTHVGGLRTTVDFQDVEGKFHSPPAGLLYPTGLGTGQMVWVEYQVSNPDLVKVAGRRWTLAVIPAASVAAVATGVAALCWWRTGVRQKRRVGHGKLTNR